MKKILIIDSETTGFHVADGEDKLIEVACLELYDDKILSQYSQIVYHDVENSCEHINKITNEMIHNGETLVHVARFLASKINKADVIVVQNAGFDVPTIKSMFEQADVTWVADKMTVCTKLTAMKAGLTLKQSKLSTMVNQFGLTSASQQHRALPDCYLTAKLLRHIVYKEKWSVFAKPWNTWTVKDNPYFQIEQNIDARSLE